ncbi:hypothetical protein T11_9476 [Trichinella zimbabwensis]|uniref:Uncharacterized protein n=1 Tax=Trichinella zimbabwensis TaxID=268475 RepID=A0A0V1HKW8_9BILA|nr:hypothetical protein T11_9476 [Trichinella zimbabwensis]
MDPFESSRAGLWWQYARMTLTPRKLPPCCPAVGESSTRSTYLPPAVSILLAIPSWPGVSDQAIHCPVHPPAVFRRVAGGNHVCNGPGCRS